MTFPSPFDVSEKEQFCSILRIGCDRETACHFLSKTARELSAELEQDAEFHRQVLQAEAAPEFYHMKKLRDASQDEKNWRISVWWLERRSPERYGRRVPDTVTQPQLRQVIEGLADTIVDEIGDHGDRENLLAQLKQIVCSANNELFEQLENGPSDAVSKQTSSVGQDTESEAQEPA